MWWCFVSILAFLIVLAIALTVDLRTSPEEEAKRIEQQDELMAKVKNDPNEPARWIP